jgi:mono/diheme cytochrome c family protein
MRRASRHGGPIVLALLLGWGPAGCNPKTPGSDEAGPAPVDTASSPGRADTTLAPGPIDSVNAPGPDTSAATPPITPPQSQSDTPPAGAVKPSGQAAGAGPKPGRAEYEGWRQYSVHCARCHGQDVLPNPVAANLLISVAPNGPVNTPEKFAQVVSEGRPDRGMPAFKGVLSPEQINAMYAYVRGRAEKRIPPGRPTEPQG